MYTSQKAKNVEFLNAIENVSVLVYLDAMLVCAYLYAAVSLTKLWKINFV